jgi:hypothetical protein
MAPHAKFLQLKIYVLEQPIWVGECVKIPILQQQLVSVTLDIQGLVPTAIKIRLLVVQLFAELKHLAVRMGVSLVHWQLRKYVVGHPIALVPPAVLHQEDILEL